MAEGRIPQIPLDAIVGLILAGGASRRMGGGDKSLAPLAGRPLIAHVIDRLRPQVGRMLISANGDAIRFAALSLPVVADGAPELAGPLAGLLAGMNWVAEHVAAARWIVTAPADTPFIPRDLVARLAAATTDDATIAVARSRSALHPVVALIPLALRGDLATWLPATSDRAARTWLARQSAVVADFPDVGGVDPFFNVNRPDDLARAAEAIGAGSD
jgi:molybdenum cofactor guanylyltransferase